jgi:hypothetical protein
MSQIHRTTHRKHVQNMEVTYPYKAYLINGITYVPHYSKALYVGPGHDQFLKTYTEDELVAAGAEPVREMLWYRNNTPQIA